MIHMLIYIIMSYLEYENIFEMILYFIMNCSMAYFMKRIIIIIIIV